MTATMTIMVSVESSDSLFVLSEGLTVNMSCKGERRWEREYERDTTGERR